MTRTRTRRPATVKSARAKAEDVWTLAFNRALARGHEHSSAAFIADEAERRAARKEASRGKLAK